MSSLTREKLLQAVRLLDRSGVDVWMTFVRETAAGGDPVLPLILDGGLTWASALIVTATGKRIAVVGNYDADPLIASGDWDEVVPYVQGIRDGLLAALEACVPPNGKIGLNYSVDDDKADGLSHGMWLHLNEVLAGTRFANSLVSAESTVCALRAIKTPSEIARMQKAIEATDRLFEDIAGIARVGVTERHIFDQVHRMMRERGLGWSWDPEGDPIVNSGPESMIGHGIPSSTISIQPGHVFHVDLGVLVEDYSSDLQRSWYVGDEVPEDVDAAFRAVKGAIMAGYQTLKPGREGWQVDAAAREFLVSQGYPEYLHALGHQVGRSAHDGGALLGPLWDRYGRSPTLSIEPGMVFTLELGVTLEGRGYLGLEDMVVVTSDGCEWLSVPQEEMWLLPL
ncbi:MAG: Methionine aminopeptidase [Fimbriimonadaceae bacterium]|nr:Methionine aminopeptidase [Fimbriimonadaceae bacterium]